MHEKKNLELEQNRHDGALRQLVSRLFGIKLFELRLKLELTKEIGSGGMGKKSERGQAESYNALHEIRRSHKSSTDAKPFGRADRAFGGQRSRE